MYDTIIIGAGMSGLAAGIRLAMYDQRVCLLERHYAIGGLNSYYRLNDRNYDVGLHAVTNFAPRGAKHGPLPRLLRQLRMPWDDFELAEQNGSAVAFPGVQLRFDNNPELLTAEVGRSFPRERDNFQRLLTEVLAYDQLDSPRGAASARQTLGEIFTDPLLVEMLLCPIMFYGAAEEHDMDFRQFSIMFRALYLEGFARPLGGVRVILKRLVKRFKQLGGELRLRAGVSQIVCDGGRALGVVLDDGTQLAAKQILSSAGWNETLRLCQWPGNAAPLCRPGVVSFVESIFSLDCQPHDLDYDATITFFNQTDRLRYARPEGLVDVQSGIVCSPNNYRYGEGNLPEGVLRLTALANHQRWADLDAAEYQQQKAHWQAEMLVAAAKFIPDFRPHITCYDMFTPTTIVRYTGHDHGAVYGAPQKRYDARTPLDGLLICGSDQGYVGIVGTLTSGIQVANLVLQGV